MIKRELSNYVDILSAYTELRLQENRDTLIVMLNGQVMRNQRKAMSGVSARVYKNGVWGFASNRNMSDDDIKLAIHEAKKNAVFLDRHTNQDNEPLQITTNSGRNDFSTAKPRKTQRELIEFLKEIDGYIEKKYPKLNSRSVILTCLDMEKSLVTSDPSFAYSVTPRSILIVVMTVEKNGEPFELMKTFGGLGHFEDQFSDPSQLYEKIDNIYNHLMKKSEGVYADAGLKDVILDADLAGILAHEAIGHTTEADLALSGSVAGDYMNQKVASPLVTLVDFAHTALGEPCRTPVYIDDEGVLAKDVAIIENGVLKSYMHNKQSARHFGVEPTGNARAYSYSDEPLIRMRNTAILPGTDRLEDMIASIDDGYYLIKSSNGQADSTSEFMFGVTLGYEIKNGKLGRGIRDTTISGIAFDVLKSIDMISNDMVWEAGGMCGKKQPIPVSMGGPAIKCKINIGGK
ncbi:MAG: peptidase [Candidatus Cloacimonetes bacterium 4572_55]|nr:MAG: peptidase [Candidatus Cloacimonetes bacterium 4572_55]